jgi:hypothetical protein
MFKPFDLNSKSVKSIRKIISIAHLLERLVLAQTSFRPASFSFKSFLCWPNCQSAFGLAAIQRCSAQVSPPVHSALLRLPRKTKATAAFGYRGHAARLQPRARVLHCLHSTKTVPLPYPLISSSISLPFQLS